MHRATRSSEPAPIQHTEAKLQLSFKFRAAENLFPDNGDLWFGYTQQSYKDTISAPFRETDCELLCAPAYRPAEPKLPLSP